MRESKNIFTVSSRRKALRSSWKPVLFEECKKGQTSAKTGCTPKDGGGGKSEGVGRKAGDQEPVKVGSKEHKADPHFNKRMGEQMMSEYTELVSRHRKAKEAGDEEKASSIAEEIKSHQEAMREFGEELLKDNEGAKKEGDERAGEKSEPKDLAFATDPEGVTDFFKERGWDANEVEVSQSGDGGFSVEVEGEEWVMYPDEASAERAAVEQTKQSMEEDPSSLMQNENFRQFVSWSDTDARVHASDLADGDLENAKENGEIDENDPDAEEDFISERYEEHYKGIKKDPREYFVDELGWYSDDEFFEQYPDSIDAEEAAKWAVSMDGPAPTLSGYDGEEYEGGSTLWYRRG
tara:strand:- start:3266 stop:4315 length:1050 start_codon:yes stop_codon:yes gene_type:complete